MPRKTNKQKNKTKRRINKFFRGKTYKKLYNNRRFIGGMRRASSAPRRASRAPSEEFIVTALALAAAAAHQYRDARVSNAPISSYTLPSLNALVTDPYPSPSPPLPQESTLSPHPRSLTHARRSPPRPPPHSPSPLPLLSDIIHHWFMQKYLHLKNAQINRDENGDKKVTDIITTDYSPKKSTHLLHKPPIWMVEKAQQNLAPDLREDLIIFP